MKMYFVKFLSEARIQAKTNRITHRASYIPLIAEGEYRFIDEDFVKRLSETAIQYEIIFETSTDKLVEMLATSFSEKMIAKMGPK